jgi:hypothetical protein
LVIPLRLPSFPRLATVALTLMMACAGSPPSGPVVPKSSPPVAENPTPTARAPDPGGCAAGMVRVKGEYCPKVRHNCLKWMDPPDSEYSEYRCAA